MLCATSSASPPHINIPQFNALGHTDSFLQLSAHTAPSASGCFLPLSSGVFVCVCDDVLAFGCMCLFVCACWEWVMWLWASSWICHAICLSICSPVCLLSLSSLSSTPVWLLSDKCVVWEQVCVYMSSVSVFPQNQTSNRESLLGTYTHTHTEYRSTHTHTLYTDPHTHTHTRSQFHTELHLQSYSFCPKD